MGEVLVTSPVAGGAPVMPELTMRSEDKVIDGGGDGGGGSGGGGGGGGDSPSPTTNGNTVVRWEKFLPKMILRVLLVEADDSTRQIITALLRKCSYKVAAVSDGLKAWEVLKGRSHNIDLILTEVELPSISGFALLTLIMEHQICKNIPVIMMSAHDSVSTVYKCMLRGAADFLVKPVRKNELKNLWQHVWRRQASTAFSNGHQEESSCTKPDIEPNGPPVENPNDLMGSQQANRSRNQENKPEGSEKDELQVKPDTSAREKNIAIDIDTSREAIELIRSFDSYPKTSYKSSLNHGINKVDHPSPMLDLSLRRSLPSSSVNQFSDGRHGLKHSDASAFSRYINKNHPPVTSVSASISNSDKLLLKNLVEYISDTHNPIGHHGLAESQSQFPSPKERQFPVRGLRFDNSGGMYNPTLPGPFCVQSGLAHVQSPCSSGHHEPFRFQENPYAEGHTRMETVEDRGHVSSATDHSPGGSLCNGGMLARFDSGGSGSNGHVNLVVDGNNGHRSIQREAALNKFRMKRKDRCFEKKVRYESRKKLAEQRPRVKGQFVRQGQTNIPSPDTELGATKTMA